MRKILTIFSFFLFFSQLNAQRFYQINAGMGVNRYNYDSPRKYNYSTRFGLNFGKQFSNRWVGKIGFNFLTHNNLENRTEVVFISQLGGTQNSNPLTEPVILKKEIYTFAEFPFSIQYNIVQKQKFNFFISSGLNCSNLIYSKTTTSVSTSKGFMLNFDFDVFANAGLGFQYKFNEKTQFFTQPNFNYKVFNVGSILNNGFDLSYLILDFGVIKQF